MRDPIRSLTELDPGGAVEPLPASQIRRLGDARRHRRRATVTVGALLAVAAVALPFAILDGQGAPIEPATSGPTTTGSAWTTEIPAAIDLNPTPDPASTPLVLDISDDAQGAGTLQICGASAFPLDGVVDRLAGDGRPGDETADSYGREIRLYADDAAAQAALDRVRGAVEACEREEVGTTTWRHTGDDSRFTGLGDDATLVTRTFEIDGEQALGLDSWSFVRVGNALLALRESSEHADPDVETLQTAVSDELRALVDSLCVFSLEGCTETEPSTDPTTTDPSPESSTTGAGVIPADFPIDRYLPSGDEYQAIDPNEGDDGIELCGEHIWPAAWNEAYGVMVVGPELVEIRWVGNFGDAQLAADVLEDAREVLAGCEVTGASELDVTVIDVSTGYDDVTFAVTEPDGRPGGEVYQLMRVGHAVLVSTSGGEYTQSSAIGAAELLTAQSADLAQDMCVFTEAGC